MPNRIQLQELQPVTNSTLQGEPTMHYNPDGSVSEGARLDYTPPEITSSEKAARESDLRDTIAGHLKDMGVDSSRASHYVRKHVEMEWLSSGLVAAGRHSVYALDVARNLMPKIPAEHGGRLHEAPEPPTAEDLQRAAAKRAEIARVF